MALAMIMISVVILVVRADDISPASNDEPAGASHGGHVHPESVARLPGAPLVLEPALLGGRLPVSGSRQSGPSALRAPQT